MKENIFLLPISQGFIYYYPINLLVSLFILTFIVGLFPPILIHLINKQQSQRTHQSQPMKNIQINMASLTNAQKKMCVELIVHSNIKFQQKNHQYVAQIKIDPESLSKTQKQNKQPSAHHHDKKKESPLFLQNGKKMLRRAVKIGELSRLQALHGQVQVYIYPKKLSYLQLCELIQLTYDKFWNQNKKKSVHMKKLNFSEWFYKNIILMMKDKLKIEQLLVNFIDSLNFYMIKDQAFKIFYLFLAEKMPIDALFYFLVLRGLLEDVSGQRNMEKSNNSTYSNIYPFKLKNNPFQRQISEEVVLNLLKVLLNGGLSCSRNKQKSFQAIHHNLTQFMYFDQLKKKNYISYFTLMEVMLTEFMDSEGSSVNMSISNIDQQEQPQQSSLISYQLEPDEGYIPRNTTREQTNRGNQRYNMELQPFQEQKVADRISIQREVQNKQMLRERLYEKVEETYSKLNAKMSEKTAEALKIVLETILQLDKSLWIRYRGQLEQSELFLIQKLQESYKSIRSTNILMTKLVKNILLIPVIRHLIVGDIKI